MSRPRCEALRKNPAHIENLERVIRRRGADRTIEREVPRS